jgi:hypothetical protein
VKTLSIGELLEKFATPRVAECVLKPNIFYSTSKNAPASYNAGALVVNGAPRVKSKQKSKRG